MNQTTNSVLMVRPAKFRANPETAVNNYYQNKSNTTLPETLHVKAQQEFDELVTQLKANGIHVVVVDDTAQPDTPDAIFPNNWISFHQNANVVVYPMFAPNRRLERREDVLDLLESEGFSIKDIIDYTAAEDEGVYLEGTGSMVLDRVNRKAYCALSPRTDEALFIEFCEDLEYTPVLFTANQTIDKQRKPIYHTNVMLSVGTALAVICLEAIDDKKERKNVLKHLKADGKTVLAITEQQVAAFAGNILELQANGKAYIIMSTQAEAAFTKTQLQTLQQQAKVIAVSLDTIEAYGGGSARCMLAEIFLPRV